MKTKIYVLAIVVAGLFVFGQSVYAIDAPGNFTVPGGFNGTVGFGTPGNMIGHGGAMLQPGGSSLAVGSDGTSYIASPNATDNITAMTSTVLAITSAGGKNSITLHGMAGKLIVGQGASSSNYLIAPAVVHATATASPSTVLYIMSLPLSQSATPTSVNLEGMRTSMPVVVSGNIYITTAVWTASTTKGGAPTKTSYLYVVSLSGAIVSQVSY
ncbi:hypothetical protein [Candidatus Magnetominusculus dajiuhuensis]|uniref:hypothetical protein n=1 Tax=Candidatus Magnetominusculus dajiuhuensis TaxID=3137712 RepID=UPI003B42851E